MHPPLFERFHPLHLACVGVMAVVGLIYLVKPHTEPFMLFQLIDLIPNLIGHLAFSLFGDFAGYLGGPVVQVTVPFSAAFYLFSSRQLLLSSLAVFWAAHSLFDVALYARDARALTVVLIGGPDHTWNSLLGHLELLKLDQFVGTLLYLSGLFMILVAMIVGLLGARRSAGK